MDDHLKIYLHHHPLDDLLDSSLLLLYEVFFLTIYLYLLYQILLVDDLNLTSADDAIVSSLISVGKHMAKEVGIAVSGYKLVFNVERGGGQMIFHLHLHLLGGWKR